ncbi:hypothetical protein [Thermoanaerobacter thermocopriae]|uniref:hypothetical protein n=1 Tax=Thermoanaerobacter thermocopriae TaxID=29350 RepID=UPI0006D0A559|nr:hypothetical protein [Thermoanaerobacter thermocopriae]
MTTCFYFIIDSHAANAAPAEDENTIPFTGSTQDRITLMVVAPALQFYSRYRSNFKKGVGSFMDLVYSHVCGLDVHKKNVVALT